MAAQGGIYNSIINIIIGGWRASPTTVGVPHQPRLARGGGEAEWGWRGGASRGGAPWPLAASATPSCCAVSIVVAVQGGIYNSIINRIIGGWRATPTAVGVPHQPRLARGEVATPALATSVWLSTTKTGARRPSLQRTQSYPLRQKSTI